MISRMTARALEVLRTGGPLGLVRHTSRFAARIYRTQVAQRRYRASTIAAINALPSSLSPTEAFDFATRIPGGIINPWQIPAEFLGLLDKVFAGQKIQNFAEIGTLNGGTLFCFCRMAAPDALAISLDLPGGIHGGGWPSWKGPVFQSFVRERQRLHLVRADSHATSTLAQVSSLLSGARLDFLFIDGDHTYDGVKMDFSMYSPLVRPGGFVAFHDIAERRDAPVDGPAVQVPQFWSEVREKYESWEFIASPSQGYAGIGVIRMP